MSSDIDALVPSPDAWLADYISELWDKTPEHYWLSRVAADLAAARAERDEAVGLLQMVSTSRYASYFPPVYDFLSSLQTKEQSNG
jgi:hypothetical protein